MVLDVSERYVGSPPYSRLDQDDPGEETFEKNGIHYTSSSKWSRYWYLVLFAVLVTLAGAAGYLLVTFKSHGRSAVNRLADTVFQVRIGTSREIFQYNSSFAAPPPQDGGSEPVWDSMIPNGLGYVKDTNAAINTSVLSVFHQLHCLYTVRRAFYSTPSEGSLEDFDLGKERKPHVAHCFDYLRQGILCSADSSIEPAVDTVNGFLGAGFPRQCRDFEGLKDWAEDHRAFDAHGFLVEIEHG